MLPQATLITDLGDPREGGSDAGDASLFSADEVDRSYNACAGRVLKIGDVDAEGTFRGLDTETEKNSET